MSDTAKRLRQAVADDMPLNFSLGKRRLAMAADEIDQLRADLLASQEQNAELAAHGEKLMKALGLQMAVTSWKEQEIANKETDEAIALTPPQCLAEHDAKVLLDAAAKMVGNDNGLQCYEILRRLAAEKEAK